VRAGEHDCRDDLAAEREKRGDTSTAILRLEQLYPLAGDALREAVAPYGHAELVWVQEEPENQGAWTHVGFSIALALQRTPDVVSRPASASPASGMASKHAIQQQDVVERAFAR